MTYIDTSGLSFSDQDLEDISQTLFDYVNQLPDDETNELGSFFISLSEKMDDNGSPTGKFTKEATRWLGQTINDGELADFNLSASEIAAAGVEAGTDAALAYAIGIGVAAAFWALPVAVLLPSTILGGFIASQIAVFSPLLYVALPFVGKWLRKQGLEFVKDFFGQDFHDDLNNMYNLAGEKLIDAYDYLLSPLFNEIFDPLVLDLDGDGIELTGLDGSDVYFDLSGDGRAERTGWVSPDDGLLAIDLNDNGTVDGIGELFGSSQTDGFAQLERLDTNGDGVIDASDEAFSKLRVWRDLNQNGVSDDGELVTLEEAGITSISLSSSALGANNNGHTAAREAVFSLSDGSTGSIQSIFFQTDNQDTILDNTPGFTIDPNVANLPQLQGSGEIHSIGYVATNDAIFAADWQALTDSADGLSYTSLRQQFSDLLLRWAGVEDEIEGSRGPNVDAQHLAFVEKFFGSPYQEVYDGGVLQNFPSNQEFGDRVEASFHH